MDATVPQIAWEAPVELVISTAPPSIRRSIYERQAKGDVLMLNARVSRRGDRYWAVIRWNRGPALSLPLDCWATETLL